MLRKYVMASVFCLALPIGANASCNGHELAAEMTRYGITAEVTAEQDTYDKVKMWRDGDGTNVYVDKSDGDLIFREWYGSSYAPNLRKANDINMQYKFVKAAIDDDGDLQVSYYVANFEEGCSSFVRSHAQTWWNLEEAVEEFLEKAL